MSLYDLLLDAKYLDRHARPQQKRTLIRLAFAYYIRKGTVSGWVATLQKLAEIAQPDFKFNPMNFS